MPYFSVSIYGNQMWQLVPNLTLDPNTPLLIRGSQSVSPWRGTSINPDGDFSLAWDQSIAPALNFCMLAGRYGNSGTPFAAGTAFADANPPAGSLYLAPNDGVNFSDNSGNFSAQISTGQAAFNNLILELSTYGITVYQDGVPSSMSNGQAWTFAELRQLLIAVQTTARALYFAKYSKSDRGPNVPTDIKNLFKNIMRTGTTNLTIYRVTNSFTSAGNPCNGTQNAGCTNNNNSTIALYGAFYSVIDEAQYTIVHELGHRFNNQSGVGGTSLRSRLDGTNVIVDCTSPMPARVLGRAAGSNNWERGLRGWGDVIPSGITYPDHTTWQQNIISIIGDGTNDETQEIDEATADMFLNWVYRRFTDPIAPTTPDCPNGSTKTIGSWLGFRNLQTDNSTFDDRLPGDARYWWMTTQLKDGAGSIFSQHTNWIK